MKYTVNQLAKLAGITVRTLHHYDEMGLLKPAFHKENGYRIYEEKELRRLQQILFFRELEFSLEDIKRIMSSPDFDEKQALLEQKKLLLLKQKHVEKLLQTIDKTLISKGGERMNTDDSFSAFNDPTYQKHKDEAKARWGSTEAYQQSMERVRKMSKAELDRVRDEGEAIARRTAELMEQGFLFDSEQVQKQVDLFYKHLSYFYDPSYELFRGLGKMYVDDPRFTEVYEKRATGFAVFMRDAMGHYADSHESAV